MAKKEESEEGMVTGAGTCQPQPCSWPCLRGSRADVNDVPKFVSVPSGTAEAYVALWAPEGFQQLQVSPCRAEKCIPMGQASASYFDAGSHSGATEVKHVCPLGKAQCQAAAGDCSS